MTVGASRVDILFIHVWTRRCSWRKTETRLQLARPQLSSASRGDTYLCQEVSVSPAFVVCNREEGMLS